MSDRYDLLPEIALLLDAALNSGWPGYAPRIADRLGVGPDSGSLTILAALREALAPPPVITDSGRTCPAVNGDGWHCHRNGEHDIHEDDNGDQWREIAMAGAETQWGFRYEPDDGEPIIMRYSEEDIRQMQADPDGISPTVRRTAVVRQVTPWTPAPEDPEASDA